MFCDKSWPPNIYPIGHKLLSAAQWLGTADLPSKPRGQTRIFFSTYRVTLQGFRKMPGKGLQCTMTHVRGYIVDDWAVRTRAPVVFCQFWQKLTWAYSWVEMLSAWHPSNFLSPILLSALTTAV